jgi:hypothetical protein
VLDPEYNKEPGGKWNLQTDGSRLLERTLEYQFLGLLTAELLRRGQRFEILRGDIDLDGHDVVVEVDGVARHIQLKAVAIGGKTREVPINVALGRKASGCVIWMTYDPQSFAITGWRWFGGVPGAKLPHLGNRLAKHSRANKDGLKAFRQHTRILSAGAFTCLMDIADVADRLFGPRSLHLLRQNLRSVSVEVGQQLWLHRVRDGDFHAIPEDLTWADACDMAHLIDGYDLAEKLSLGEPTEFAERQLAAATETGIWQGDAAELWVTLFLEHRRWKYSSPFDPAPEMVRLLDNLVDHLRSALTGEPA